VKNAYLMKPRDIHGLHSKAIRGDWFRQITTTPSRPCKFCPGRHFFPGAIFSVTMIAFTEE
jgi:hypothetical protein